MNLDLELLNHLAIPESYEYLQDEGISADLVEDDWIKQIVIWARNYYDSHGQSVSSAVLEEQYKNDGLKIEPPEGAVGDLVDRLKRRWARNQAQEAIRSVGKASVDDPLSVSSAMIEKGRRLGQILNSRRETFSNQDVDKAVRAYNKRVIKGRGPSFGFAELDDFYWGQEAVTYLIGPPKSGKSWVTVKSIIANMRYGKNVYLSCLEMPPEVFDMRIRCMLANVPFWKYLRNKLDDEDILKLKKSLEMIDGWGTYIVEKPKSGDRSTSSIFQRAKDFGADVIYVDQLQYCESKGRALGATNDTKDFFDVCNEFKDLSDELPIWVVHQFNRTLQGSDSFPVMQQIKSSSAIEESGTLILGLWANRDMQKDNVCQIGTLASRNAGFAIWEIKSKMSQGCELELLDRVDDV